MLVKKRGKRILSLLLSVLLTVGVFSVVPIEVGAAETDSAPFLVTTSIAFILCAIAIAKSTGGGLIQMFTSGQGKLSPTLIVITVVTALMDGLGYMIRSDYKKVAKLTAERGKEHRITDRTYR